MSPGIVLIHAEPMAVEPVGDAFARIWPEAETVNLLEDSLSRDRAATGHLDRAMMDRFRVLGDYATGSSLPVPPSARRSKWSRAMPRCRC
jgi:hypothetical protein